MKEASKFTALTLAIMVVLMLVSEGIARAEVLPLPYSRGSEVEGFDLRLDRLEALQEEGVAIDCVFLGPSLVERGIDPLLVTEVYQARTGESMTCFNFGVSSSSAVDAHAFAQLMMQEVQPRLIVYGFSPRGISPYTGNTQFTVDTAWMQHRLGNPSAQGWLVEHSLAYRQFLAASLWWSLPAEEWQDRIEMDHDLTAYGFYPIDEIKFDPIDADPPPERQLRLAVAEPQLAALSQLVAMDDADTDIILVQMPIPASSYGGYDSTRLTQVHEAVDETTTGTDVPYWRTQEMGLVPDDGWWDRAHMNVTGATAFSEWLGTALADYYDESSSS